LSKEEIDGGNLPVAGNDEICPGVCRLLAGAAGYPSDPPANAGFDLNSKGVARWSVALGGHPAGMAAESPGLTTGFLPPDLSVTPSSIVATKPVPNLSQESAM
jgi:hypothetical protein